MTLSSMCWSRCTPADELDRVLNTLGEAGADAIGVNNRDLKTFEVRLETSLELVGRIPVSVVRVAESGISTAEDIARLRAAGFDAFLIGESLMRQPDPGAALAELLAGVAATTMSIWIKICGNTSLDDARLAVDAGADAVGFVFAPSPRRVTVPEVAAIVAHLPATVEKIGVFVDAGLEEIYASGRVCGLTGVQLHSAAGPEMPAKLHQKLGPDLRVLRVLHFEGHTPRVALRGASVAWLRAKCKLRNSRAGCTVNREKNGNSLEPRSKSRTGDRGASVDSTCSNLNFSAHAITGRHTSWSITTTIPIITPMPHQIARVFPAFAAVCR